MRLFYMFVTIVALVFAAHMFRYEVRWMQTGKFTRHDRWTGHTEYCLYNGSQSACRVMF